ncbi:hypothetical protein DYBT9275_00908 [Dyadobacter sp. CECT 9275]|uniref:Uncharacterized protein n=1 Tax=Dyadobacter helix TaxID=2822344 RepID=A0A916NB64_9BACT|nr:hypothetical protein [Dyadobacter sp. CECT 9275]CAG4992173.1 hypothetical protein DYBT9275_00908 [Dyadobacter sp. CECT 9275]
MPWNYDDAQINGIIDSNIKSAPPAAPQVNTAAVIRSCLKLMWAGMRGQVSQAVAACDATTASLVARSLNLTSTIYVDGVNGNDARTGTTNDHNAATGRVKTMARVIQLHNDKTQSLDINIVGNTEITVNTALRIPFVFMQVGPGVTLTFKKVVGILDGASVNVGDGTYKINFFGFELNIYNSGTITVEAHGGSTGNGDQYYYRSNQGAIGLASRGMGDCDRYAAVNVVGPGTINGGANTIFVMGGANGLNPDGFNKLARYRRSSISGGSFVAGSNAVEYSITGDRIILRSYHPTGSSDGNVSEGEVVISPTTNQIYAKRGGVVRLIQNMRRYHPTSSTDAAVWEGETVVSPTNNDLYFKSNGTIRRITTAAYS